MYAIECGEQSQFKPQVKDRWVKGRVTVDSGAAGHVMLEAMFPRVKLERKTAPKKLVAAFREQIRTNKGAQRCITSRNASVVKPFIAIE